MNKAVYYIRINKTDAPTFYAYCRRVKILWMDIPEASTIAFGDTIFVRLDITKEDATALRLAIPVVGWIKH
jgi:hypothetical protein